LSDNDYDCELKGPGLVQSEVIVYYQINNYSVHIHLTVMPNI